MDRSCLLIPFRRSLPVLLAAVLIAGFVAPLPAVAQKRGASPTPKPSATPRPLTADKIGAGVSPTDNLPDPVAKVNGQAISRSDLLKVAEALLASNGRRMQDLPEEERKKFYSSVLGQIIDDRLITAQCKEVAVDDMTVEKTYDNLKKQYGDEAAFDAQLKKSGQTPDKIRANIRGQVAQQQWLEKQLGGDAKITPLEVEKFYKESPPTEFDIPEMIRASHILVAVRREAPPEDSLAAENKINALNARLKKGDKFADVAKEGSEDSNSKDRGGDLGLFSRERVLPEIGDAAFKLKVGEVSPPVRSPFGYHLILLTERKPAHAAALDEVRPQIEEFLKQRRRSTEAAKVVQKLRDDAKIENFLLS